MTDHNCVAVIIDDLKVRDKQVASMITTLLGQPPWECRTATTPEEAERRISAAPPPAVVVFDVFYGPLGEPLYNFREILFNYIPRLERYVFIPAKTAHAKLWAFSNYPWYSGFQPHSERNPFGLTREQIRTALNRFAIGWPNHIARPLEYESAADAIANVLKNMAVDSQFSKAEPDDLVAAIKTLRATP